MSGGVFATRRTSARNVERFAACVTRRVAAEAPKIARVAFARHGRRYVAIRFRGGRVELYRVEKDGFAESWMRYARAGASALDDLAMWLLEDRLDEAATLARLLLSGAHPRARNVRMGEPCGEWGSVLAEVYDPSFGTTKTVYASIRLYQEVSR